MDLFEKFEVIKVENPVIPAVTGFEIVFVNIGEVQNRGFEFELNAAAISNSGFNWNVTANLSHNTNLKLK